MKKRLSKSIALLLCTVMLCSTGFDTTASAAETRTNTKQVLSIYRDENGVLRGIPKTVTEEVTVPTKKADKEETAVIQRPGSLAITKDDEYGDCSFTSFEDLKTMAADPESYDEYSWTYTGTDQFVFEESIDLPGAYVDFSGAKVIVPEGVSVDLSGNQSLGTLWVGDLLVEGSVTTEHLWIYGKVEVTGKLNVIGGPSGGAWVFYNDLIGGMENVTVDGGIVYVWQCTDAKEFARLIKMIDPSNDVEGFFNVRYEMLADDVLETSLVIPENTYVTVFPYCDEESEEDPEQRNLTIPKGVTLTVDTDEMYFDASVTVEGKIVNNQILTFTANLATDRMLFADGSEYTGKGQLVVYPFPEEIGSLADVLPGLDLTDYECKTRTEEGVLWWELRYCKGLAKLEAPTDLLWGFDVRKNNNQTSRVAGYPGYASWKNPTQFPKALEIEYFETYDDETYSIMSVQMELDSEEPCEYLANRVLAAGSLSDGDYFFTVTNAGDYEKTADSDTAISDIWRYTEPDAYLGECTNMTWNWPKITWDGPEGATRYIAEWYFCRDMYGESFDKICTSYDLEKPEDTLPKNMIDKWGPGYYCVDIWAVSTNIEEICNGASEESDIYYYAGTVLEKKPGDLNGDESVNDDDVILLLWHTLLPDMYPIQGEADFNADNSVNDEDVIYLLWHTLLPDLYPL